MLIGKKYKQEKSLMGGCGVRKPFYNMRRLWRWFEEWVQIFGKVSRVQLKQKREHTKSFPDKNRTSVSLFNCHIIETKGNY